MRNRIFWALCVPFLFLTLVSGEAMAIPMQRTVTVVDESNNVVLRENILYSNTYKQPETKILENNAIETTADNQNRNITPATSRSAAGSDSRLVIKTASELLGKPYSYGAGGPNSFDCSGFTAYVYRSVGINLPHNAEKQYNVGVKVSRSDLIAGDLVFFGYYGSAGINHVGIYTGEGTFIHASTNNGVITTPLDAPYYVSNYKGATRVLR